MIKRARVDARAGCRRPSRSRCARLGLRSPMTTSTRSCTLAPAAREMASRLPSERCQSAGKPNGRLLIAEFHKGPGARHVGPRWLRRSEDMLDKALQLVNASGFTDAGVRVRTSVGWARSQLANRESQVRQLIPSGRASQHCRRSPLHRLPLRPTPRPEGSHQGARPRPRRPLSPTDAPHSCSTEHEPRPLPSSTGGRGGSDPAGQDVASIRRRNASSETLLASRLQTLSRFVRELGLYPHSFDKRRISDRRFQVPDKGASRFSVFLWPRCTRDVRPGWPPSGSSPTMA